MAGRGLRRLGLPRGPGLRRLPAARDGGKKKILGLNAAKLYDIEVPAELQLAGRAARARDAELVAGASPSA